MRALGNYRTTIFGALVAIFMALAGVEGLKEYAGVFQGLAGLAGAVGLALAKDAQTGSPPGSTD